MEDVIEEVNSYIHVEMIINNDYVNMEKHDSEIRMVRTEYSLK